MTTTLSRTSLERLLHAGERVQSGVITRARSIDFRPPTHPYWAMPVNERDAVHADLVRAERAGAVTLEWNRHGGEDRTLDRIRLRDVGALADYLGVTAYSTILSRAERALWPWRADVPSVIHVLDAWRRQKPVRRRGADEAPAFADAARVIAHMRMATCEDEPVRLVSRKLFKNSKRIEALVPLIDVLTADTLTAPALHWEYVLSGVGLRKEPLAFFFAGRGVVQLREDDERELSRDYVAFPPTQIVGFRGAPAWVLSIENRETFHLAARRAASTEGLVLYTGGMPSPAWRRAYRVVVDALPKETPIYHWGDIDDGGFRVASCVAQEMTAGRLRPWRMDPRSLPGTLPCKPSLRQRMVRTAARLGWHDLAAILSTHPPVTLEQEELDVELP